MVDVLLGGDDPKDPVRKFHHTKRMLKPVVGSTRVDEMRQRQLMNVPKALKRARIENLSLVRIESSEDMHRIPYFVDVFLRHFSPPRSFQTAESQSASCPT
jgi:hypothetical protein